METLLNVGQREIHEREQFVTKKMVIKIGSSTITGGEMHADIKFMGDIARQISVLFHAGVETHLVTSGAVASGKRDICGFDGNQTHRQLASAAGQIRLMTFWQEAFSSFGVPVFQVLITPDSFEQNVLFLTSCKGYGIPIINANELLNTEELDKLGICADNDRLAAHLARCVDADTVVFLTDTAVRDMNGNEVSSISPKDQWQDIICFNGTSSLGTGGMASKHNEALHLAEHGTRVHIGNGRDQYAILNSAKGLSFGTMYRL
ncbi:hypothetical protein CO051_06970 [Candidatus Roizmanbacteria bacterium CG_4_9_14_0_2_um_filter_39_13]|uniref:Aspartate/glutamate/uridylate kinase domain-containing protein n=2 Tax=Candidatus Roizmaniibacteriota TaxID=1752723 RepID=A0A2M8EWE4_9BACT|nr:MAG: hypothetical protein COY15_03960 [Candidatus Roizmanbacteria bacterium CG_4_10_14_0_2_um_filter_39_12]PJC30194.1 MAG: hypothetical protein CO051_06970 [Candidatus Roizmanbacteria bacterium CG_4_9_14_0_2_um_filter_39_13]PJE61689.1 MAG: hypothetical protein COU87_03175 [Candidatus Roizmanbacteria bacterium CG10_big_fil_rev_8_21_14_0_10_39_12]